jgi:hypothetical protein
MGYEVVLSLAELDPALGGNPGDLLPYADTRPAIFLPTTSLAPSFPATTSMDDGNQISMLWR